MKCKDLLHSQTFFVKQRFANLRLSVLTEHFPLLHFRVRHQVHFGLYQRQLLSDLVQTVKMKLDKVHNLHQERYRHLLALQFF